MNRISYITWYLFVLTNFSKYFYLFVFVRYGGGWQWPPHTNVMESKTKILNKNKIKSHEFRVCSWNKGYILLLYRAWPGPWNWSGSCRRTPPACNIASSRPDTHPEFCNNRKRQSERKNKFTVFEKVFYFYNTGWSTHKRDQRQLVAIFLIEGIAFFFFGCT